MSLLRAVSSPCCRVSAPGRVTVVSCIGAATGVRLTCKSFVVAVVSLMVAGCEPYLMLDAQSAPNTCGNGVMDPGEACDDGNLAAGDRCAADCRSDETCGNGIVDRPTGEVCDDGNSRNGDDCSADCRSDERCGNGVVDIGPAETCDDGNTVDGDGCSARCQTSEACGNGVIDGAEACDEGPGFHQGCDPDCTLPDCGDGAVNAPAGEACDDADVDDTDQCLSTCVIAQCGDGHVLAGVEMCDDGGRADNDGCSSRCEIERCGDGVCNFGERCATCREDCGMCPASCGNGTCDVAETCQSCPSDCGGCPSTGDGVCDAAGGETCMTTPQDCGVCQPRCGDGVCNGAEQCDECPDCGACPCSGRGPESTTSFCQGTTRVTSAFYACEGPGGDTCAMSTECCPAPPIGTPGCEYVGPSGQGPGTGCQRNTCVENAPECRPAQPDPCTDKQPRSLYYDYCAGETQVRVYKYFCETPSGNACMDSTACCPSSGANCGYDGPSGEGPGTGCQVNECVTGAPACECTQRANESSYGYCAGTTRVTVRHFDCGNEDGVCSGSTACCPESGVGCSYIGPSGASGACQQNECEPNSPACAAP